MCARGLRFGTSARDIVVHNRQGDHWIVCRQPGVEKGIQFTQCATLLPIAVAHSTLQCKELGKLHCQWRDESELRTCQFGTHRPKSFSDIATPRRLTMSTRV